jgi:hypothetical protein
MSCLIVIMSRSWKHGIRRKTLVRAAEMLHLGEQTITEVSIISHHTTTDASRCYATPGMADVATIMLGDAKRAGLPPAGGGLAQRARWRGRLCRAGGR